MSQPTLDPPKIKSGENFAEEQGIKVNPMEMTQKLKKFKFELDELFNSVSLITALKSDETKYIYTDEKWFAKINELEKMKAVIDRRINKYIEQLSNVTNFNCDFSIILDVEINSIQHDFIGFLKTIVAEDKQGLYYIDNKKIYDKVMNAIIEQSSLINDKYVTNKDTIDTFTSLDAH